MTERPTGEVAHAEAGPVRHRWVLGVPVVDGSRYVPQGLWGLMDQRATRLGDATGRADVRVVVVAAVRELLDADTNTSTGTRSPLIRPGGEEAEGRAWRRRGAAAGPDDVRPLGTRPRNPTSASPFYKVVTDAVATGRHTFGSAVTRQQMANRPQGMLTPSFAARPGEQLQIDSTPIDVMVLLDNGVPVRADLTIVVRRRDPHDLRRGAAVGTKAVDAALLHARLLASTPGWELAAARPVIAPDTIVIDGEGFPVRHVHPRL